ncbi:hypothetical protein [Agromyces sp. NPDC057865]|uniref:hypothetical protein n=1 Tax=Agromyces sp. NPDC057865 TaxID=3346267 RepID=UPI00366DB9D6
MTSRATRAAASVAIAIAAAALVGCAGASDAASDPDLQLVVRDGNLRALGDACAGARPFDDIHPGAELVLRAGDGADVLTTALPDGEAVKIDDIDYGNAPRVPSFCRFALTPTGDLPDGPLTVLIDGEVVAEGATVNDEGMVFVPPLADVTGEGSE